MGEWEVEGLAKSLILKFKFGHTIDQYLYVPICLRYVVSCYCLEMFVSKWTGKKVTETGIELYCAQLAQKCLFVIHLVSLFVCELVMNPYKRIK